MSNKEIYGVILHSETKTWSFTGEPLSRREWRALDRLDRKGWEWDGTWGSHKFTEEELLEGVQEEMQRRFEEELRLCS
ncbi:hypothetical protein ES705_38085 [subsurface metagenome]